MENGAERHGAKKIQVSLPKGLQEHAACINVA
jgi:hypothetical protein